MSSVYAYPGMRRKEILTHFVLVTFSRVQLLAAAAPLPFNDHTGGELIGGQSFFRRLQRGSDHNALHLQEILHFKDTPWTLFDHW